MAPDATRHVGQQHVLSDTNASRDGLTDLTCSNEDNDVGHRCFFKASAQVESPAHFGVAFKGSPMKRAKFRGLKRNAALVLGNVGDLSALPALTAALSDGDPLVRAHAA